MAGPLPHPTAIKRGTFFAASLTKIVYPVNAVTNNITVDPNTRHVMLPEKFLQHTKIYFWVFM